MLTVGTRPKFHRNQEILLHRFLTRLLLHMLYEYVILVIFRVLTRVLQLRFFIQSDELQFQQDIRKNFQPSFTRNQNLQFLCCSLTNLVQEATSDVHHDAQMFFLMEERIQNSFRTFLKNLEEEFTAFPDVTTSMKDSIYSVRINYKIN